MINTHGYAVMHAGADLVPYQFDRRNAGPNDINLEILYCGICHSDLNSVNNYWGGSHYPLVPGHEIIGRVIATGQAVKRFKVGDFAAIGCYVDSCRVCPSCVNGEQQFCVEGMTSTSGALERGSQSRRTQGGYSNNYVVDAEYALKISPDVDLAASAPLLCAGITTWSPLQHWKIGAGCRVGIVGIGGLGHIGLKFAMALGAEVVIFTTSRNKVDDALRLGAKEVVISTDTDAMRAQHNRYDFVLDTISVAHDLNCYIELLKRGATLCLLGVPDQAWSVNPLQISGHKCVTGSMLGGLEETQQMLDFCAQNKIGCEIELINIDQVNAAHERVMRNDVKFRFVIDMASL